MEMPQTIGEPRSEDGLTEYKVKSDTWVVGLALSGRSESISGKASWFT